MTIQCDAGAIPRVTGRRELGAVPRGVIAGTGQAMIHHQATVEDVVRMAHDIPAYTYGSKLEATLTRMHPDMLRAMRLPSRAHRI